MKVIRIFSVTDISNVLQSDCFLKTGNLITYFRVMSENLSTSFFREAHSVSSQVILSLLCIYQF